MYCWGKKDAQYIFYFISSIIDEIGLENVIQFVTDNASNHVSVGNMKAEKHPHIFNIKCASHCIEIIFKDFDNLKYVSCIRRCKKNYKIYKLIPTCLGLGLGLDETSHKLVVSYKDLVQQGLLHISMPSIYQTKPFNIWLSYLKGEIYLKVEVQK